MKFVLRTKILLGVAAAVGAYVIFSPADSTTVEPARNADRTPARVHAPQLAAAHPQSAAQALNLLAHRVADATAAASLFAAHSWYVAPPPPPPPPSTPSLPPPKPTAPPLPFQYMGSYTPNGGAAVIFLTRGDVVYDVRVGDTLDSTYSVDRFDGATLLLTYKPLNIQQQLNAGSSP